MVKSDLAAERRIAYIKAQVDAALGVLRNVDKCPLCVRALLTGAFEAAADLEGYLVMRRLGGRTGAGE